ncbi:hypothetical protein Tco_1107167 [Tanacetum coccineum]
MTPHQPLIDLTYEKLKEIFFGTERAVGLLSWLEEMGYVLYINKYPAESQVEFASSQPWEDLKKLLKEEYCSDNAIEKFKEEF